MAETRSRRKQRDKWLVGSGPAFLSPGDLEIEACSVALGGKSDTF